MEGEPGTYRAFMGWLDLAHMEGRVNYIEAHRVNLNTVGKRPG